MSALHLASEDGHSDMVELLLNYHPQLEVKNNVSYSKHIFCLSLDFSDSVSLSCRRVGQH